MVGGVGWEKESTEKKQKRQREGKVESKKKVRTSQSWRKNPNNGGKFFD